jgi:hypothetical protein
MSGLRTEKLVPFIINLNNPGYATGGRNLCLKLICFTLISSIVLSVVQIGVCFDDFMGVNQEAPHLAYSIIPEEVEAFYSLDFSFNHDLVDIQVEKNSDSHDDSFTSKVECLIDFDVEAILPYNYSKNLRLYPMTVAFLYPKGASGIKVRVNNNEQTFKLVLDSTKYINENVDKAEDYVDGYDVLTFDIPWDKASIQDNRHLHMHPFLNITYSKLLNSSNGEYILKYGLIALDYRVINLLIKLPENIDVNMIKSKPKLNIFQDNANKYMIYMDMAPEAFDSRRNLTDVEVIFKPKII